MSYTIHWGGDPEDVLLTVSGPADEAEFVEAIRAIRGAPQFHLALRVLIDERHVDWTHVTSADVRHRASTLVSEDQPQERHLVAVVVERKLAFGLIRMLQTYIEGDGESIGRVFYDFESARDWLRAPR